MAKEINLLFRIINSRELCALAFADIAAFLCLFILLLKGQTWQHRKIFIIYAGTYFILPILNFNPFNFSRSVQQITFGNLDNLFTLLEIFVYTRFFLSKFTDRQKKIAITLTRTYGIVFILYTIIANANFYSLENTRNIVYTSQSLILILYCTIYYSNIFYNANKTMPSSISDFWITTGLFCMLIGILPFSIAEQYLRSSYRNSWMALFSIYYILYATNFLMIIYSSFCKKKIRIE
jgi:hypothetical protein